MRRLPLSLVLLARSLVTGAAVSLAHPSGSSLLPMSNALQRALALELLAQSSYRAGEPTGNNTEIGCVSRDIYELLIDHVVLRSDREFIKRVSPDPPAKGDQTGSFLILGSIVAVSLFLMLSGEYFARSAVFSMALLISLLIFLALFETISERHENNGFLACVFPLSFAIVFSSLFASIITCLSRRFFSVYHWLFGVCLATVTMLLLRDIILVNHVSLVFHPRFHLFWLALIIVSLFAGFVSASNLRPTTLPLATACVGGYLFAVSLTGLVPLGGRPALPAFAFFLLAPAMAAFGFYFQYYAVRRLTGDMRAKATSHEMYVRG